ncbi:MAG: hypothetical protein K8I82_03505 [Anaerolineae bacterium]|nr:hypothetical protein [Anaerolineae bacterium]
MAQKAKNEKQGIKAHKMPEKSVFFDKVMPALFIVLAVVMVGLIIFAFGVVTGIVQWS